MAIKCRRDATMKGSPQVPGYPAVPPERVYVVRRSRSLGAGWFHVRFSGGARLCVHANRMEQ